MHSKYHSREEHCQGGEKGNFRPTECNSRTELYTTPGQWINKTMG